jgi:hypothetical protein
MSEIFLKKFVTGIFERAKSGHERLQAAALKITLEACDDPWLRTILSPRVSYS